jgi:hypothetical protein
VFQLEIVWIFSKKALGQTGMFHVSIAARRFQSLSIQPQTEKREKKKKSSLTLLINSQVSSSTYRGHHISQNKRNTQEK